MSWNILPKNVLQYFLTKLKGLMYTKTEVDALIPSITPNPSTTTGVLNGLEINGTAYEIQGTGEPNVQADWNEVNSTADDYIKNKPSLAAVATSGSYNDLSNRPSLATVATSGSYNDLSNKPTIPTYNFLGVNFHSGASSSQEHNCNNMTENGLYYYQSNGPATSLGAQSTDGAVLVMAHSANWLTQLAQDYRTGKIFVRSRNSGSWMRWREVISSDDTTSNVTMDDVATWGNTMGMVSLKSANANVNPNNQNGWHHFINLSYTEHSGSNMWQTQIACKAGTSDVYVRSRSGGSISGAAWVAPWVRLAKAGENVGNFYNNVGYITGINKTMVTNALGYTPPTSDTNNAVTQNDNNGNNWNLRLLLSGSQDDTTRTQGCYKTRNLQYNDYWKALYIGDANRNYGMVYSQGSQQLNISASAEENYRLFLGVRESTWSLAPLYNQYLKLGTGSFKWNQIYSSSATINTSDRRKKKDIQPLDENARIFVMKLNPVSYKLKDGETGRTHYGMIAQDIEDELTELGMTAMDFAGFCKDEVYENVKTTREGFTEVKTVKKPGEYIYGLRYEEFIAPLIKTVQLQQQEIEELKHRIDILEGK